MSDEMKVDLGGGRERMVRVDYPANSRKAREKNETKDGTSPTEKAPNEKVVTGDVTRRKKSFGKKFVEAFLPDKSESIADYLVMEILVPAAKNMISDAVSETADAFRQGVERALFGDSKPRGRTDTRPGYFNYQRVSSQQRPGPDPTQRTTRQRATHDFSDFILQTRGEAEDVLEALQELIKVYDVATVADLYELVGVTGEFTDNKWGWYDLESANVRAVRGGYLLQLPRTHPIT